MKQARRECPTCKETVSKNHPFSPFCSDRCRLLDLGKWLGGRYRVESHQAAEPETEVEE
ncbi:MAG: DNA gyrase inhibitor YacG [Acidobacteriota bacterium]